MQSVAMSAEVRAQPTATPAPTVELLSRPTAVDVALALPTTPKASVPASAPHLQHLVQRWQRRQPLFVWCVSALGESLGVARSGPGCKKIEQFELCGTSVQRLSGRDVDAYLNGYVNVEGVAHFDATCRPSRRGQLFFFMYPCTIRLSLDVCARSQLPHWSLTSCTTVAPEKRRTIVSEKGRVTKTKKKDEGNFRD